MRRTAVVVVVVALLALLACASLVDAKKKKASNKKHEVTKNDASSSSSSSSSSKPEFKAYSDAERAALTPVRRRMIAVLDKYGESCVAQPQPSKSESVLANWPGVGPATSCGFVAGEFLRKVFPAAWKKSSKKLHHWQLNKLPARAQLLYRAMRRLFSGGTVNGPAAGRALGCLVETKNKQTVPGAGDVFYLRDKKYPDAAYATRKRGEFADENVAHVGTVYRARVAAIGNGGFWWQTVDGGQGSRKNQCTHKMVKAQQFRESKDAAGAAQPYMCLAGPRGVPGDSDACRVIHGWLNLDCVARAVDEYVKADAATTVGKKGGKKGGKKAGKKGGKKAGKKAAKKEEYYYF